MVEHLPGHGNQGRTKYPWDEWLNGKIWLLTEGVDFSISITSMQSSVTNAARNRGLKVTMRKREEGLYVQAIFPEHWVVPND
jgi:hypothetical protein